MFKQAPFVTLPARLDSSFLERLFGIAVGTDAVFDGIGDLHSNHGARLLSFLSDEELADTANRNPCIAGIFCRASATPRLDERITRIVVDDPKFYFFSLMDHLARQFHVSFQTVVGLNCAISASAKVSLASVRLGDNVTIEPGVYVAPGTLIGNNVILRANATVGVDGFQHQRTSHGTISPLHDGWLTIEDNVEIGCSASISRGFSYRETRIGAGVKIDALAYVAHGTSIGTDTIVCAHACVMGHVNIGRMAWLGPGCIVTSRVSIGEAATISIGSVVSTDIPDGARYTGNFAIPHQTFISDLKARTRE